MNAQAKVLDALRDGEQSVNELAVSAGLPQTRVIDALLALSMANSVQSQEDQGVVLWRLA